MGNVISYLKWRGDLTFAERAFCEVDNLVLSILAYFDFTGIVPAEEEGREIPLSEAAKLFYDRKNNCRCAGGPPDDYIALMAASNRYRDVRLSNYAEELDEKTQIEFSALHIALGDGTVFVAFRGTSDSLLGWREDFSMSFQLMPAQKRAAEYLEKTMPAPPVRCRVGGHSKGGNLAVYASMMCPREKQKQIIEVYSNDGPGLCQEIIDISRYQAIQDKTFHIVPEFSVIGALFEYDKPTKIVTSSVSGLQQHDGMSWQIEGDRFCTCEERSKECRFFNQIFDQWIESASMEQKKAFTNDFFDALEAGGAKKRSELGKGGFDGFESILLSMVQSEGKSKIVLGKLVKSVLSAFTSMQFAELLREKETLQGLALFVLGIFMVASPEFAARCVGGGIGIFAAIWCGKKQIQLFSPERRDEPDTEAKLILNMMLMCASVFLVAQQTLLLHFSNILIGGFFLFFAYKQVRRACDRTLAPHSRVCSMAFAVVAFILGIVPIVASGLVMWQYVLSAGMAILLYGVGKIVHAMYENGKEHAGA